MYGVSVKKLINLFLGKQESVVVPARRVEAADKTQSDDIRDKPNMEVHSDKAKRILLLKSTLEFDADFSEAVSAIQTMRGLLSFVHQEIFSKIQVLHDIGVINQTSYESFRSITNKTEDLLALPATSSSSCEDLAIENTSLKRQLASLYSKHVKNDIISENELTLENDNATLRSRLDDLTERYKQAQAKAKSYEDDLAKLQHVDAKYKLLATKYKKQQAMLSELETSTVSSVNLEVRIKHLTSKMEYQEKLINALTWNNPQKTTEVIANISSDNYKTRESIESINDDLGDDISKFVLANPGHVLMKELFDENMQLYKQLETTESQLVEMNKMTSADKSQDILENLENECDALKGIKEIKENIKRFLSSVSVERNPNPETYKDLLTEEKNILLKALKLKTAIIESFDIEAVQKRLTDKIARLTANNRQSVELLQRQNKIIAMLKEKNVELQTDIGNHAQMVADNKRLKTELAKKTQYEAYLAKMKESLAVAKKQNFSMQSQVNTLANTVKSLEEANSKLDTEVLRLKNENESLIAQYNKLFGDD
ncbi:MAG: hypothetical protein AAGU21_06290 [Solidesulfovibrio sp.]|uniref:hypothetical protein n=1 Tax=Solidesulfovibrio sp. TaxID=2910990 RepID=UPI0031598816